MVGCYRKGELRSDLWVVTMPMGEMTAVPMCFVLHCVCWDDIRHVNVVTMSMFRNGVSDGGGCQAHRFSIGLPFETSRDVPFRRLHSCGSFFFISNVASAEISYAALSGRWVFSLWITFVFGY